MRGGSFRVLLELLDFVLEVEFLALEFENFGVVRSRVVNLGYNRFFDGVMAAHQFAEMRNQSTWDSSLIFNNEIVTHPAAGASGNIVANCDFAKLGPDIFGEALVA